MKQIPDDINNINRLRIKVNSFLNINNIKIITMHLNIAISHQDGWKGANNIRKKINTTLIAIASLVIIISQRG